MIWMMIWKWVLIIALAIFICVSILVIFGGAKELWQLLFNEK